MPKIHTITIFSGSADGLNPLYYKAARNVGACLAQEHIAIVFGGGKTGLMGAVADGALAVGGEVIGVINHDLNTPALAHSGLTRMEVFPDLQARKLRMLELADAFIALPGGLGTFDELFEALTLAQIGLHQKPIGLLEVNGYFEPLIEMVEHAIKEGFIYPEHRALIIRSDRVQTLLHLLETFQTPKNLNRWVERAE